MYTEHQQQQQSHDYAHLPESVLYHGIYGAFNFIYSKKNKPHCDEIIIIIFALIFWKW